MARDEIVKKIDSLLRESDFVDSECCVLYLMVELRKIIDHLDDAREYPLLKFYCDWTVHTKKDRNMDDIRVIVDRLDKLVPKWDKLNQQEQNQVLDFIQMPELRKEMGTFLRSNGLQAGLCDEARPWKKFTKTLCKVLSDQPIVNPSPLIGSISLLSLGDEGTMVDICIKNGGSISVGMGKGSD